MDALEHLRELDRRDAAVAAELATLDTLVEHVAETRAVAARVAARLSDLPADREEARRVERVAAQVAAEAASGLDGARAAAANLGRRASDEERDQVERELKRAEEDLHDAEARLVRARARIVELDDVGIALEAERAGVVVAASELAATLVTVPRLLDAGKTAVGEGLDDIEEWGSRARAALFVTRSTLAAERERIVLEANAFGSSALGEDLGGLSVALVLNRLERMTA